MNFHIKNYLIIVLLVCIYQQNIEAGEFNDYWQYANLYNDAEGNFLKLSGRLHIDSAWFDGKQGQYSDITWRRFRFGLTGQLQDFSSVLEADINLNNNIGAMYNRITDAKITWQATDLLKISALKQSSGFTLDGKTSSKKLYTPQRNNLSNNLWFTAEYFTGLSGAGKSPIGLNYNIGIYSSDDSDEVSISNGSYFTLLAIEQQWERASIRIDYVHNDLKSDSNTRSFSEVISVSAKIQFNALHIWSDFAHGKGGLGQSDVNAWVVMPIYKQHKNLQWVARYTWLDSNDDNGLRLGRYEQEIVGGLGDHYQEIYMGVNWMFNSHKLKVQLGAQYTQMKDRAKDGGQYEGLGTTLALRSYW